VENKAKPNPNLLQMAPNFAGAVHTLPEAHTTKTRMGRLLQGAAAPLWARLRPIFIGPPHTDSPMTAAGVWLVT
jgi:hypothetical protein